MGGAAPKKPGGMMPRPNMGGKPPKMMADGGLGSPSPFGGGAPAAGAAPPAPKGAGGADPDMDGDMDSPAVKPEAVNYHDDPQSCSTCQYMGEGGQCAVLQMQVSPEGGCTAFESKGGEGEDMADDMDDMGGDQMDDMAGGPPPQPAMGRR